MKKVLLITAFSIILFYNQNIHASAMAEDDPVARVNSIALYNQALTIKKEGASIEATIMVLCSGAEYPQFSGRQAELLELSASVVPCAHPVKPYINHVFGDYFRNLLIKFVEIGRTIEGRGALKEAGVNFNFPYVCPTFIDCKLNTDKCELISGFSWWKIKIPALKLDISLYTDKHIIVKHDGLIYTNDETQVYTVYSDKLERNNFKWDRVLDQERLLLDAKDNFFYSPSEDKVSEDSLRYQGRKALKLIRDRLPQNSGWRFDMERDFTWSWLRFIDHRELLEVATSLKVKPELSFNEVADTTIKWLRANLEPLAKV